MIMVVAVLTTVDTFVAVEADILVVVIKDVVAGCTVVAVVLLVVPETTVLPMTVSVQTPWTRLTVNVPVLIGTVVTAVVTKVPADCTNVSEATPGLGKGFGSKIHKY